MMNRYEKTVETLRGIFQVVSGLSEEKLVDLLADVAEGSLKFGDKAHEAVVAALEAEGIFNNQAHDRVIPMTRDEDGMKAGKVYRPAVVAGLFDDEE